MLIQADASDCKWLVSDHLGSPRIIIGKSGSLLDTKRRDFMPFGEDLGAGQFGRTPALGYEPSGTPSNPREKFATYERDDETGLDFAQARYYQSKLGRFTTPDEFTGGPAELFVFDGRVGDNPTFYADLDAPQSLNKYQYCLNNPLRYVDPYGHQQTATAAAAADAAAIARQARMANAQVRAGAVARSVHPVAGLVILAAELLFGTPEGRALLHEAMTAPARLNLSGSRDEFGVRGPNFQNIMQAQAQDAAQPPPGASGQASGGDSSKTESQMAEDLSKEIGKNSVETYTPSEKIRVDLKGKAHFDKPTNTTIPTPHVQTAKVNRSPSGQINTSDKRTKPATKADVRTARRIIEHRKKIQNK